MLDNSINVSEGGTTRRRSTFYVPLCENPSDGRQDGHQTSKTSSGKKIEKNHLERISFSPFKRTPKKSLTPPIYESQEPLLPRKHHNNTPLYSFSTSKTTQRMQPNRPRVERTPVRISHLQQPQKPRTLDASKLLKTPCVSVPSLDNSYVLRKTDSNSLSLETLKMNEICKTSCRSSNPFVKRTDSTRITRVPPHGVSAPKNPSVSKISLSSAALLTTDSSSALTIAALQTPPKDSNKSLRVPSVVVERDDANESVCSERIISDKNYLRVVDDEDAGIHSGKCLGFAGLTMRFALREEKLWQ